MKIRKFLLNSLHYVEMLRKDFPGLIWNIAFYAICKAIAPYWHLYFSAEIVDDLLVSDFTHAIRLALIMIIGSFVMGVIRHFTMNYKSFSRWTQDDVIQKQLMEKAVVMEYETFETPEAMDHLHAIRNNFSTEGGANMLVEYLHELPTAVLGVLLSLGFLFRFILITDIKASVMNPFFWLLIIMLVFMGICNTVALRKSWRYYNDTFGENDHKTAAFNVLTDTILKKVQAKKDIMLNNLQSLFMHYIRKFSDQKSFSAWRKYHARRVTGLSVLTRIYTAACYIFVISEAIDGHLGFGQIILYVGCLQALSDHITWMLNNFTEMSLHLERLEAIYDYLHQESIHNGALSVKNVDNQYELEFRDVSFTYPGTSTEVLHHVNLKFEIRQKLALVGRNGAGKSTIVNLLCRLYKPTSGEILLNGVSIWEFDFAEYTSIFEPVFQDFGLFSLPVAENIACEVGDQIDSGQEMRIREGLQKAGIYDRVDTMQDGIYTQLYHDNGEGVEISGGEAQKLAIARAWYKDAPFVILDEPTAALDPLAEAEIYEHFNDLVEDKTAIYISHRMSSCKFCDRIVVLKDGEIAEDGTHAFLLKAGGEYAELYNAQAEYYQ